MKIVALGDSLTYGYMLREEDKWINIINKDLNLNIINQGINGDTTFGMINRFEIDVKRYNPDIVLIWGGSNDFYEEVSAEKVIDNLTILINKSKEANIIPIIIITPPVNKEIIDFYPGIDLPEIMNKKTEKLIKHFKNTDNYMIDLYSEFEKIKEKQNIDNYYLDSVHLSKSGNIQVATIIKNFLKDMQNQ